MLRRVVEHATCIRESRTDLSSELESWILSAVHFDLHALWDRGYTVHGSRDARDRAFRNFPGRLSLHRLECCELELVRIPEEVEYGISEPTAYGDEDHELERINPIASHGFRLSRLRPHTRSSSDILGRSLRNAFSFRYFYVSTEH